MKIRKPFVMGGMLLVAALLFLSMFMDMSAPQEMERQTISLRAEAEDLSIDDMINTSDKRKSPSNDVVAPGFAGNVGEYASSSVSTYRGLLEKLILVERFKLFQLKAVVVTPRLY